MAGLARVLMGLVFGVVLGAALVLGYFQLQPAAAALGSLAPRAAEPAELTPAPGPAPAAPGSVIAPNGVAPAAPPAPAPATAAPAADQGTLALEATVTGVYDRVAPAVVFIANQGAPRTTPFGQFPQEGVGSGVVVDEQGHILTNNHVVSGAQRLEVTLSDGTTVPGTLLGRDPGNDLALVKVDVPTGKLHVAVLGDSDAVRPGQLAIAIGNPFDLDRTVTVGFVSAVGRTRDEGNARPIRNMLQTDAAINPGNSGGPLLNSKGEVIGINTSIESPVRGSVGVGFAVPINAAKAGLTQMLAGKTVDHPWLGISGQPLTPNLAQQLGVATTEGVYVVQVVPDSPAAKAGLKGASAGTRQSQRPQGTPAPSRPQGTPGPLPPASIAVPKGGDVITALDGRSVTKVETIGSYLDTKQVGDTVKLTIVREGQTQTLEATLAAWPDTN